MPFKSRLHAVRRFIDRSLALPVSYLMIFNVAWFTYSTCISALPLSLSLSVSLSLCLSVGLRNNNALPFSCRARWHCTYACKSLSNTTTSHRHTPTRACSTQLLQWLYKLLTFLSPVAVQHADAGSCVRQRLCVLLFCIQMASSPFNRAPLTLPRPHKSRA